MGFFDSLMSDSMLHKISDTIFSTFDGDKSGTINSAELEAAVDKVISSVPGAAGTKIPAGGVKAALDKLDKNQDGTLDKEEFFQLVKMITSKIPLPSEGAAAPAPVV